MIHVFLTQQPIWHKISCFQAPCKCLELKQVEKPFLLGYLGSKAPHNTLVDQPGCLDNKVPHNASVGQHHRVVSLLSENCHNHVASYRTSPDCRCATHFVYFHFDSFLFQVFF
ncbi:unnamed protein product [Moneuplotes crassus]|uniref:Uncharacterized protein n=1 Tax=Euplotes crassus TaxID=5936 RepID=A0AAD1XKP4_EUPCR|nr:unnamed protein product [Moneuplotes crassus]